MRKIKNPNYRRKTVEVIFKNGTSKTEKVYTSSHGFYILLEGRRTYLLKQPNGVWLDQMLTPINTKF